MIQIESAQPISTHFQGKIICKIVLRIRTTIMLFLYICNRKNTLT